ncbi:efflux transporter outer membrane subunit [Methylotenera sp.]|uniref:efflux transporter outer membrane subunit n=1 Tax=Methylotenera sp. TaxID=2051956 RepID=UPI0024894051|nr:efflux transporter outer membrane subunit [Methylotenera sp.]MDI1360936.1 efflux transporter outer membrane subunit [Methylotenera sp.]
MFKFHKFNVSNVIHTARNITAAAVMISLVGCVSMSGINPKAKSTQAVTLKSGQAIASASHIEWPTVDWWKAYHDKQLDALIDKAVSDSPTLRMAQSRVNLVQAYADSMHAETLPNIGGDASAVRQRFTELQFIPTPSAGNWDWDNKMTASIAYDLDLWGRQESIWNASVNETNASKLEVQQVKLELVNAVTRSYVQLAMEYQLRDLAEEYLAEVNQRVAIKQRSMKAGLGNEMEVIEAETPLPLARAKIEVIDERIKLLRNQLAALSGQGPGAGDSITRPSMTLEASAGLPDTLQANLVGRRPDVLAHRLHVEAAQENIEGAKKAFYPNINLIGFIGFQALGFGQLLSTAAGIAGAGPAISLPIFDGGRRRGNLSAKTASYDIAVENYNTVLVKALQDVSDQLVIMQSNRKQIQEVDMALASAKKAHHLAEVSYSGGLSNYQHVLDTNNIVIHQQEIRTQLQAVRLDAYAGLMRALGGGTVDETIAKAMPLP